MVLASRRDFPELRNLILTFQSFYDRRPRLGGAVLPPLKGAGLLPRGGEMSICGEGLAEF